MTRAGLGGFLLAGAFVIMAGWNFLTYKTDDKNFKENPSYELYEIRRGHLNSAIFDIGAVLPISLMAYADYRDGKKKRE